MPTITLRGGDFGSDVPVTFTDDDICLPDPQRPGLSTMIPLAEIVEMEAEDGGGWQRPVKEALSRGAMAIFSGGASVLADGFSSATKVKDVTFAVRLQDGRHFTAVTDAKTYADFHSAQITARSATLTEGVRSEADEIVSRWLQAAATQAEMDAVRAASQPPPAPIVPPKPDPVPTSSGGFGRRQGGPKG